MMIVAAQPEQNEQLVRLAERTGVFKAHELLALQEVLEDYHAVNHEYEHQAVVMLDHDTPVGFAYLAPTAMTDRTWELWWIAVDPVAQGLGFGRQLLIWAEARVEALNGRLLLIETSSTAIYEPTRIFYQRCDYHAWATIPDFYADGDGKVIFGKRMLATRL
jgi:GNAT superfamily N-acetyltransferase